MYTAPTLVAKAQDVVLQAGVSNSALASSNQTTISLSPHPLLTGVALPATVAGGAYSAALAVVGGTAPFQWSVLGSALPAGLTLNSASGMLSGSPQQSGSFNFSVQVTDASASKVASQATYSLAVSPATALSVATSTLPLRFTTTTLPSATLGLTYSSPVPVTGGKAPYACSLSGGSLPSGITLNNCSLSGRFLAAAAVDVPVQVTDSSSPVNSVSGSLHIALAAPALQVLTQALRTGTVGVSYTNRVSAIGGTAPYSCSVSGGALPTGLTLKDCVVSGSPKTPGVGSVTFAVTDQSAPAKSASASAPWTMTASAITASPLSLISSALPGGVVGGAYHGPLTITGGAAPYRCTILAGTLPSGVALNGCTVTGTPTKIGSGAVTVQASDASSPALSTSGVLSWAVTAAPTPALTLVTTSLPSATVGRAYSSSLTVRGGTAPYSCSMAGVGVPKGMAIAGCALTGTPSSAAPSASFQVQVTDAGQPAVSTNGTVSLSVAPSALSLASTDLANATVGVHYAGNLTVAGGTAPYQCSLLSGSFPGGLSLNGCSISGTPTTAESAALTIGVSDGGSPVQSSSAQVRITVAPAGVAMKGGSIRRGVVGIPYDINLAVFGGVAPYSCTVTSGALAAGLHFDGCAIKGTPTEAATGSLTVRASDSQSPASSANGKLGWTIDPVKLTLTTSSLPNGTAGVFYTSPLTASGGTVPYQCSVVSGSLPAGLTISGCNVQGTPAASAAATLVVQVKDAGSPAATVQGQVKLSIAPAVLTLGSATLPVGTAGQAYSGLLTATGGTAPYSYSVVSGSLLPGLTLAANGAVTGIASQAGSATFTAKVSDGSSPAASATHAFSIAVSAPSLTVSSGSLPVATVSQPYSAPIGISGGTAPFACSLISGSLPNGLALNGCTVAGSPTAAGHASVTVRVMDASSPTQTASGSLTMVVSPSALTFGSTQLATAKVNTAYSATLQVNGGVGNAQCAVTGGSLPAGLQLNASTCTVTGTPTVPGTTTVTVTATDANTPVADSASAAITLTVSAGAMSVTTTSLANPVLGQPYHQGIQVAGGQAPYTFTVTGGALPRGLSLSATGVVSGTPTAAGASSFLISVTDGEASVQTAVQQFAPMVVYAAGANNAQLSGSFAFLVQGYDAATEGDLSYQTATAGSFVADGHGLVTGGEMDSNHQSDTGSNGQKAAQIIGTYQVGADDRGLITLTTLNQDGSTGASNTFQIAAAAEGPVDGSTTAVDGVAPLQPIGAPGILLLQDGTTFASGLKGSYAFGFKGDTPCLQTCVVGITGGPVAEVGQFTANGAGAITGGVADSNIGAVTNASASLSGSYGAADSGGRLQMTLNTADTPVGIFPTHYAVYLVNSSEALVLSTDSHATHALLSGTSQLQTQTSFSDASLNGAVIGYENAMFDPASLGLTLAAAESSATSAIFRVTSTGGGSCAITNSDVAGGGQLMNSVTATGANRIGVTALLSARQATGAIGCAVSANGRGVLPLPQPNSDTSGVLSATGLTAAALAPRVVYLVSPNRGYFLETGYAALGSLEPQAGVPFSSASLSGTYSFGIGAPASATSTSASGTATANGSGWAVLTPDAGLSSQGLLLTGTSQTTAYTLTDAAAGRFTLSTAAVYALSPNRLIQIDLGANVVSPSVGAMQR